MTLPTELLADLTAVTTVTVAGSGKTYDVDNSGAYPVLTLVAGTAAPVFSVTAVDVPGGPVGTTLIVSVNNPAPALLTGANIGGVPVANFTTPNGSAGDQVQFDIPAGSSTGALQIETSDGNVLAPFDIVVGAVPTVDSITPTDVSPGGTVTVTLINPDNVALTGVSFDSLSLLNFTNPNATTITFDLATDAASVTGFPTVETALGDVTSPIEVSVFRLATLVDYVEYYAQVNGASDPVYSNGLLSFVPGVGSNRQFLSSAELMRADGGKYYWEVTPEVDQSFSAQGIAPLDGPNAWDHLSTNDFYRNLGGLRVRTSTGTQADFVGTQDRSVGSMIAISGTANTTTGFMAAGQTFGFLLDLDNETFEAFDEAGVSIGSVTLAQMGFSAADDRFTPAMITANSAGSALTTFNFGSTAFVHPLPAGASGVRGGPFTSNGQTPISVNNISPNPVDLTTITSVTLNVANPDNVPISEIYLGDLSGAQLTNIVQVNAATFTADLPAGAVAADSGSLVLITPAGFSASPNMQLTDGVSATNMRLVVLSNFDNGNITATELAGYATVGDSTNVLVGSSFTNNPPSSSASTPATELLDGIIGGSSAWFAPNGDLPITLEILLGTPSPLAEVGFIPSASGDESAPKEFTIELSTDYGQTYVDYGTYTVGVATEYTSGSARRFTLVAV